MIESRGKNGMIRETNGQQEAQKVVCTFEQFFAVWASIQIDPKTGKRWEVPALHLQILRFLTNHHEWENNTGVLQVSRGFAKSTIVGLFVVWMLSQNPTLRFLILSADKKTAGKVTADVANIIRKHPFAKHLFDDELTNRADSIFVRGFIDARTPSITSWGVKSNITGSRADWVIYDDTEVPKNVSTESERENLRAKLDEPTHILVPGGYELFVGTPHAWDSIYPEILGESTKDEPFRTGATGLKIPALEDVVGEFPNLTGTPTWPNRFPVTELQKKQRGSKTKGHFMSQYLLLPYNPDDTVLDPTLIATYRHEIDVHTANGSTLVRIGPDRAMGVSAFWDPSLAKLSTDDSVLSIVFTNDEGHYFIHRAVELEGDAEEQCKQVIQVMKACQAPHVLIETNGIGGFLPAIFRKVAAGSGVTCEGRHTTQNKLEKIRFAYEARLTGGYIHAHKSVMDSKFRTQLRDFNHKTANRSKDDFIDSVAMAILAQPVRIKAGHFGVRASLWQQGSGGYVEAEMDAVAF